MKNKVMKIVTFMMILFMVASILLPVTSMSANYLDPSKVQASESTTAQSAQGIVNTILGVVQAVAIGVAVIMLIVLAIKYISAAPGEKADIKKSLVLYIVGAAFLFGATGILQIIKTFASNIK